MEKIIWTTYPKIKEKRKFLLTLSYNTQIEILENVVQSLSGPTTPSSNYTSAEEQDSSFDGQDQNLGPNEQVESIATSQGADENHSAPSQPNVSQSAVSRSSELVTGGCTSSERANIQSSSSSGDEFLEASNLSVDEGNITAGSPLIQNTDSVTQAASPLIQKTNSVTQAADQSKRNTSSVIQADISTAGPSQLVRPASDTAHWNFPARDNIRASGGGSVAARIREPVITVQFDNIPAISDEPLSRGRQDSRVPTVLPDGTCRTTKSRKTRTTKS